MDIVEPINLLVNSLFLRLTYRVGWWEYDLGSSCPLPLIKRTCAISRTLGNRRLGDNVMTGNL